MFLCGYKNRETANQNFYMDFPQLILDQHLHQHSAIDFHQEFELNPNDLELASYMLQEVWGCVWFDMLDSLR